MISTELPETTMAVKAIHLAAIGILLQLTLLLTSDMTPPLRAPSSEGFLLPLQCG